MKLRKATRALPPGWSLKIVAQTLVDRKLEGAGDQRADYWAKQDRPLLHSRDLAMV